MLFKSVVITFLLSSFACKTYDQSAQVLGENSTVVAEYQLVFSAPAKTEAGYEIYFYRARVAGMNNYELKAVEIADDLYASKFKVSDIKAAIAKFTEKQLVTGDPVIVIDVYQNDGYVSDTKLGRVVIDAAEIDQPSLSKGISKPVLKNLVNNDENSFKVTVTRR